MDFFLDNTITVNYLVLIANKNTDKLTFQHFRKKFIICSFCIPRGRTFFSWLY